MTEQEEIYSERKHIIEFGDFNEENYMDFLKEANASIEYPYRELLISSNGGNMIYVDPMKHVLEKGDFTITAYSHIISAGFILFMVTEVPKTVLRGTTGAFHFPFLNGVALNANNTLHIETKLQKEIYEKESYASDFFQELLGITNVKRKKLESNIDEYLIYDDKQLQKLADKSLLLLEKYK